MHPTIFNYYDIPELAYLLHSKGNFFQVGNLDFDTMALSLSRPFELTKLFPTGSLILVTDEVFARYPDDAFKIVHHIMKMNEDKERKTWKLVGRPGLQSWLRELVEQHADAVLSGKEQSRADIRAIVDHHLCPPDRMDPAHMPNPGENAALVSLPPEYRPEHGKLWKTDEKAATSWLVDWFGGWTCRQAMTMRRFMVVVREVGEEEMQWRDKWRHVDVLTVDKYLKRFQG